MGIEQSKCRIPFGHNFILRIRGRTRYCGCAARMGSDSANPDNSQSWGKFVATCLIGGVVVALGASALLSSSSSYHGPHLPLGLPFRRKKKRPVRVYMDGCFDMMHYGHCNALRQGHALGDQLVVGVVSDAEITANKGPPVTPLHERFGLENLWHNLKGIRLV